MERKAGKLGKYQMDWSYRKKKREVGNDAATFFVCYRIN
jgi:hypothetical protein